MTGRDDKLPSVLVLAQDGRTPRCEHCEWHLMTQLLQNWCRKKSRDELRDSDTFRVRLYKQSPQNHTIPLDGRPFWGWKFDHCERWKRETQSPPIFNQVTTKLSHPTPSGSRNAAVGMTHVLISLRDCGMGEERQLRAPTEWYSFQGEAPGC